MNEENRFAKSSEIFDLVQRFEDCSLRPESFTNSVAATVALWHLSFEPSVEAKKSFQNAIKRYAFQHSRLTLTERRSREACFLRLFRLVRRSVNGVRDQYSFLELANAVDRVFRGVPEPPAPRFIEWLSVVNEFPSAACRFAISDRIYNSELPVGNK